MRSLAYAVARNVARNCFTGSLAWQGRFAGATVFRFTEPAMAARSFASTASTGKNATPTRTLALLGVVVGLAGTLTAGYTMYTQPWYVGKAGGVKYLDDAELTNWSGTHSCKPKRLYEPENVKELETIIRSAHREGAKIRPVGMALSPNGLAMCEDGMLSLTHCDRILKVDPEKMEVTVEAGARVSQVLRALKPYNLTLQNFSSIQEQQMGGWTQVAAHGTGASLPTVEEQIVRMKLVTPAKGSLELSDESNPELFSLAKVGLGALGVVSELTLRCVPAHQLLERTFVTTHSKLRKEHAKLLRDYRHLRLMWLPWTDGVVVVASNPYKPGDPLPVPKDKFQSYSQEQQAEPLRKLMRAKAKGVGEDEIKRMSFAQMRDYLLDAAPLDVKHVAAVNQAELEYWKRCEGYRLGDSTEILGFDCGGQQWVLETVFPVGSLSDMDKPKATLKDLDFVQGILQDIRTHKVPAPAPIEQRWTAASRAKMSPAYHPAAHPGSPQSEIFSWVGIIMYLPPGQSEEQRDLITSRFREYGKLVRARGRDYALATHWAKLEVPEDAGELAELRASITKRFPVEEFARARKELDPKGVLSNTWVDALFPTPAS
eukprot:jgi/Mesvir1/10871/Mv14212-RA.1